MDVGADLEMMRQDAGRRRGERPFVFTDLSRQRGLEDVVSFIVNSGGLRPRATNLYLK
jgi:urease accessory protein